MTEEQYEDYDNSYFRFSYQHPGFLFSCLTKRKSECLPKLYYNNKFPDVAMLETEHGDDVEDSVKQLREEYALMAMLLFFPFWTKNDLIGDYDTLWQSFLTKKNSLSLSLTNNTQNLENPTLYKHSLQILQHIQDLINIKRMPSSKDRLECCTEINETSTSQGRRNYIDDENEENDYNTEDDALNIESQVLQLTRYVNILSQEMSPFNSDT